MAKIFISHSKRDENIKNHFIRAFRGTGVEDIYYEYEDTLPTGPTAGEIAQTIELSAAVFVLLSETVQSLPHTRDWILWECGIAKNKPIWVFEPDKSFGRINVVIPSFAHYVRFRTNEDWRKYIQTIAKSYNDSHLLTTSVTTGIGAMAGGWVGAGVGLLLGRLLDNRPKCPPGVSVVCARCYLNFRVHIPADDSGRIRCTKCNNTGDFVFLPQAS